MGVGGRGTARRLPRLRALARSKCLKRHCHRGSDHFSASIFWRFRASSSAATTVISSSSFSNRGAVVSAAFLELLSPAFRAAPVQAGRFPSLDRITPFLADGQGLLGQLEFGTAGSVIGSHDPCWEGIPLLFLAKVAH